MIRRRKKRHTHEETPHGETPQGLAPTPAAMNAPLPMEVNNHVSNFSVNQQSRSRPESPLRPKVWKIGDHCQVYSKNKNQWMDASVRELRDGKIVVEYAGRSKALMPSSNLLREDPNASGSSILVNENVQVISTSQPISRQEFNVITVSETITGDQRTKSEGSKAIPEDFFRSSYITPYAQEVVEVQTFPEIKHQQIIQSQRREGKRHRRRDSGGVEKAQTPG